MIAMLLIARMLLAPPVPSAQAISVVLESKAIDLAKSSIVRDIDPTLPRTPLAQWLSKAVSDAETKWEVNDCGEQSGNPAVDRGRDFPMCVQADVTLAKNRHLYLLFVVGTFAKGITPGPPQLFYGTITENGQPTRWIKKLGEVPVALGAIVIRHD